MATAVRLRRAPQHWKSLHRDILLLPALAQVMLPFDALHFILVCPAAFPIRAHDPASDCCSRALLAHHPDGPEKQSGNIRYSSQDAGLLTKLSPCSDMTSEPTISDILKTSMHQKAELSSTVVSTTGWRHWDKLDYLTGDRIIALLH